MRWLEVHRGLVLPHAALLHTCCRGVDWFVFAREPDAPHEKSKIFFLHPNRSHFCAQDAAARSGWLAGCPVCLQPGEPCGGDIFCSTTARVSAPARGSCWPPCTLTVWGLSPTCHTRVGIKINDGCMLPSALAGRPSVQQGPIAHVFMVFYVCPLWLMPSF